MNKLILVGNVGSQNGAELRYTPNGVPVASFTVASNNKRGENETTVWFRVTCWRGLAETCAQYVKRGMLVYVEGRFDQEPRIWTNRSGESQASLEIIADTVKFLTRVDGDSNGQAVQDIDVSVADETEIPF